MIRYCWVLVLAVVVIGHPSQGLIHPKSMSNLYSSSDYKGNNNNDETANFSLLTSDTLAEAVALRPERADNVIQQPEQHWIKPSPKGLTFS